MSTNIDNLIFNLPHDDGSESSQVKYVNNYGVFLTRKNNIYSLYLLKKINDLTWTANMDDKMTQIVNENGIFDLTKEVCESYMQMIENIVA